jgi:hypothetical protein
MCEQFGRTGMRLLDRLLYAVGFNRTGFHESGLESLRPIYGFKRGRWL